MPKNEKYNPNKPYINYLNKDFTNLKNDLINYAKTYFPNSYRDFNETSPGMMMMEMNAYVGDVLSFYIDQQFKEMFVSTVEERANITNLAKTFGYRIKPIVPALVNLEFTQTVGVTGDGPNKTPHMVSASVLDKGVVVESDINGISFEVLDIVDFNLTGSYTPEVAQIDDSTGVPSSYTLKTTVPAVSAETKQKQFKITSPDEFLRLTLPDINVISIISVLDSNNEKWNQVEYLAQDKIYDETHWTDNTQTGRNNAYDDDSDSTNIKISTPVPYRLNSMKTVNKRFVVETNSDNTTSLVFGNGLIRSKGNSNTSALEDVVSNNVELNALVQGTLPTALNPTVDYRSLGESPSNTTLTITYRVGGGVKSNVPARSISNVTSKKSLLPTYNTEAFQTITVINPKEAAGGADEESLDQIRENIKGNFSAQNRCVTKDDYEFRALSLPARFGNIAKVYVKRRAFNEQSLSNLSPFNLDQTDTANTNLIGGENDALAFEGLLDEVQAGVDWTTTDLQGLVDWVRGLNLYNNNLLSFKNLNMFILSYDHNKNLIQTPTIIKQNLANYLSQFKILSDDVNIDDGRIVNFGIKFKVISRSDVNKSDLKLRCIEVIKEYFEIENMDFQQQIYIADIENLLYNVEGVKVVEEVIMTQNATELEINNPLHADGGVPGNNVGGTGTSQYGWAYQFESIQDGIIRPPAEANPGVFELKNPLDNIKGEVR